MHPTVEVHGNLAHERLLPLLQAVEKLAVAAVQFVERPSGHANSVAQGPADEFQGDLRLCAKLYLGRNVILFSARKVVRVIFWQVQAAAQQTFEAWCRIAQMPSCDSPIWTVKVRLVPAFGLDGSSLRPS